MCRVCAVKLLLLFVVFCTCQAKEMGLRECILVAMRNNPTLKSYQKLEVFRHYQRLLVSSEFFPTLSLEFDYTRAGGTHISPYDTYSYAFNMQWEIFSGFTTLNTMRKEKFLELASKKETRKTLLDVTYSVVKAYLSALNAKNELLAAKHYLNSSTKVLQLTKARYKAGLASRSDVVHAKAQYEEAHFKFITKKKEYKKATAELAVAMGLDVTNRIEPKELSPVLAEFDVGRLLELAQENSPEIKEARLKVKAQKRAVSAVKGEFAPSVVLSGSWGKSDESLFPDDTSSWSLGVYVKLPVFTGFSTWRKLKREKAQLDSLRFKERETVLSVQLRTWKAYQDYLIAKERFSSAKAYFDSARESFKVMLKKYQVKLASIVDLTTTQARLYDAESAFYDALNDVLLSYYGLVRAVGKIPVLEGM